MLPLVLFIQLYCATAAATTGSNVTEPYVSWMAELKGRGTWGLLFNCTVTLILCVWSVIHMSIAINY